MSPTRPCLLPWTSSPPTTQRLWAPTMCNGLPAPELADSRSSWIWGAAGTPGGITQYDSPSTLNSTRVNGAIFGAFASVDVDAQGFVSARFTNGVVRQIYQVPVATVANPNGLATAGGSAFFVTPESGAFTLNAPGAGSSGSIAPKALEKTPNVDIATEFSNLITTQRAYSASSRIITTADEMMAEAIQMKR